MSYSFQYKYLCCTFKGPWGRSGNIPCCMMIALSFCCLPLVLEINIRDLLLQELRALFLAIELLYDNLPPWAIIKTDLIVLPKWHLNMMQLSESYCYNYLLIARKIIPIIILPFPLVWWKNTSLKKKPTKIIARKKKRLLKTLFFLNWVFVSFKQLFYLS